MGPAARPSGEGVAPGASPHAAAGGLSARANDAMGAAGVPCPGVLIVDDQTCFRTALIMGLEVSLQGVRFCGCGSGEEALAQVRRCRYDLAFVDLLMPGMSGLELADRIRRLERELARPSMALVAMSAFPAEQVWEECRQAGYSKLMTKPFQRADIVACLADLMPELVPDASHPLDQM